MQHRRRKPDILVVLAVVVTIGVVVTTAVQARAPQTAPTEVASQRFPNTVAPLR